MSSLLRLFSYDGYTVSDVQVSTRKQSVCVLLERAEQPMRCCRCDLPMTQYRGRHRISLKELSVMSFKTEVRFWRQKGWCEGCKKTRSDKVDFMSYETPHYTQSYAEWLGTMCEFSPVSRVAKFNEVPASTLRRIDHKRMR